METNNNNWTDALKERLKEYQEPVSAGGWERLSNQIERPKKKVWWPWVATCAAAAAAIAIVFSTGIFIDPTANPLQEEIKTASNTIALNRETEADPAATTKTDPAATTKAEPKATSAPVQTKGESASTATKDVTDTPTKISDTANPISDSAPKQVEKAEATNQQQQSEQTITIEELIAQQIEEIISQDDQETQEKRREGKRFGKWGKWAIAANFTGQTGGNNLEVLTLAINNPSSMMDGSNYIPITGPNMSIGYNDLRAAPASFLKDFIGIGDFTGINTPIGTPNDDPLMPGAPYNPKDPGNSGTPGVKYPNLPYSSYSGTRELKKNHYKYKHHLPVSFGISFSKYISERTSVGVGLAYTIHTSDVYINNEVWKQRVNTLGIPINIRYDFIAKNNLSVYIAAGGMGEKCISGEFNGVNFELDSLLWSVSANFGVQYQLWRFTSLFLEPGVTAYLPFNDSYLSVQSEEIHTFKIAGGLRFSF